MIFTGIVERGENSWFIGQIAEVLAVISQGKAIEELKENLLDALRLILAITLADLEIIIKYFP
jgi:predicted RNase H-like HicB family nuclease